MAKKQETFKENNDAAQAMSLPTVQQVAEANAAAANAAAQQNVTASYSSLDGVPEEVRKNLIGVQDMVVEEHLLNILNAGMPGMSFTVDKIILALWHRFKYSEPRQKVIARLRQMAKRGLVIKDETARSVYRASAASSREAAIPTGTASAERDGTAE